MQKYSDNFYDSHVGDVSFIIDVLFFEKPFIIDVNLSFLCDCYNIWKLVDSCYSFSSSSSSSLFFFFYFNVRTTTEEKIFEF